MGEKVTINGIEFIIREIDFYAYLEERSYEGFRRFAGGNINFLIDEEYNIYLEIMNKPAAATATTIPQQPPAAPVPVTSKIYELLYQCSFEEFYAILLKMPYRDIGEYDGDDFVETLTILFNRRRNRPVPTNLSNTNPSTASANTANTKETVNQKVPVIRNKMLDRMESLWQYVKGDYKQTCSALRGLGYKQVKIEEYLAAKNKKTIDYEDFAQMISSMPGFS